MTGEDDIQVLVLDEQDAEMGRSGDVIVLGGIGFAVEADSPLAHQLRTRPMNPDTGSLHCLDMAAKWVNDCVDNHDCCPRQVSFLPTRVLDIGISEATIKLYEPQRGHIWQVRVSFILLGGFGAIYYHSSYVRGT